MWRHLAGAILIVLLGCSPENGSFTAGTPSLGAWAYPIQFHESRSKVHDLMGLPARATPDLEEYPSSGVTVWFNPEGGVAKLNFAGIASRLYSGSLEPIVSDRVIVFGLTARAAEATFHHVLGPCMTQSDERSTAISERRCVWRKDGYLVDALFLATDRIHEGTTFPKGTLLWFEVSPVL